MKPPILKSTHLMFIFGVISLVIIITLMLIFAPDEANSEVFSILLLFRVITGLAAAGISVAIPGMLKINYTPSGQRLTNDEANGAEKMTLAEKEPVIAASGAIAVFVLVYLFNPIGI